ncbi:LPXTG cell wall anchor domain-containing protein [Mediterraneibacter glycyrrhizinilyticus]|uniref:LPXTG cell wall anchor domain-containing protein n=1 Tax=Mediterraneibacter glycyrrhizinilyticus TaxID=342942 RepID=UPI0025A3B791|nr:LPXTG cell wall anchor domain-containing protein [Mediterraneibacter glycyrrhizinilyticus]MDM8209840.1 LPXTG cell wall anchor domain-containing protein [Mediterraneibacter glycyrrhizinilyticus]
MKLKRKLLAGLLTLCMAVGMAVPAFAANGPSSGDMSYAWVQLYDSSVAEPDGSYVLYSNGGEADTVEGAVYDKATNTITLTNYNHPEMTLATNEMGDDLKLHLVGDNHIAELVVWGFGWGGNLEITGDGSLTINENKTSQTAAIRFMAEGTQGLLKVGSNASVTAYKSAGENTYSAAFLSTTSSTLPFQGNLEAALTMTPDSGVEGEYAVGATVIYEESYANRTWQLATKDNDGKLYGIYFFEANEYSEGQTDVFELVKVDGLASGNEYLAVAVSQTAGVAWPEGYIKDPEGKTVDANISNTKTMTLLQKDGETFYWGSDKIEYPPEGGEGTPWYSVYKGLTDKMEIVDHWGDKKEAVIAAPVEGMRNLTKDHKAIPEGYSQVMKKTGTFDYFCTNDVIKAVPVKDPVEPTPTPGDEGKIKDLTYSETGVSISLTNGVPEGTKLYADTMATESVLESKPGLKEELPGLLTVYQITVKDADGKTVEVKNNPMTVKIPMTDQLKGYKYYQAVYLGDPLERFDAVVEGNFLVFETTHLSQYAILGSNTPFETSEKPTDPTTPTDPTDPTDPAKPEQPDKPSEKTESPQTGDNSNMFLLVALLFASGGVLTVLGVTDKRKKKGITK